MRFSRIVSNWRARFARVAPRGWATVIVPACTSRVGLVHSACGHHSSQDWEFDDAYDEFGGPGERWRVWAERRRMRRAARAYARAHDCPGEFEDFADEDQADEDQADEFDAAELPDDPTAEWTECPHCTADGVPIAGTGEYRCFGGHVYTAAEITRRPR